MTVILLHGFGETPNIWDDLIPRLPSKFEYIKLDYSRISFCQTIEQYAQWVHSEIEQRSITRFVLVGHSMGGYISLAYAEKYPDYLAGLGLFHSTAYDDTEEKKQSRDKTAAFIEKRGVPVFMDGFLPNMYNEDFKRKNKVYIRQQLEDNKKIPADALIQASLAMKVRPDRRKVLEKMDVPVLFIAGKKDIFIPYADSLAQLSLIQKPYGLFMDHVAHAGMREAPLSCSGITTDFLEACFN
jgi:pimeloyl-ACP methyl ester carboxylesterase